MKQEIDDLCTWGRSPGVSKTVSRFLVALCVVAKKNLETGHDPIVTRSAVFSAMNEKPSSAADGGARTRRSRARRAIEYIVGSEERISQFCEGLGRESYAFVEEDKGGGGGIEATYRITLKAVAKSDEEDTSDFIDTSDPVPMAEGRSLIISSKQDESSRYTSGLSRIDIDPQSFDHRVVYRIKNRADIKLTWRGLLLLGSKEGPLSKIRQNIITANLIITIMIIGVPAILTVLSLNFGKGPLTGQQAGLVISTLILGFMAYYRTIKPFMRLGAQRILLLDEDWLKYGQRPAVLEKIDDPSSDTNALLNVTRYEATCRICRSPVILRNGDPEWTGRIVGRCINSPTEHVYTFDRFNLRGSPLRPGMVGLFEF